MFEEYKCTMVITADTGVEIDLQQALNALVENDFDTPMDHGYDPLKVQWFGNDEFLWDVNELDSDDPWYGLSWMV